MEVFIMEKRYQFSFENYLTLQRFSPRTRESYLRSVASLSAYHNHQSAKELTNNQIQDYLLYCIQEKQLAWSSCNILFCGLKKYYHDFLGRNEPEFSIPPQTTKQKNTHAAEQEGGCRVIEGPE